MAPGIPPEDEQPELAICYRCGAIVEPSEIHEDTTECTRCQEEPYFDE
jgi:hypothetical protein